MPNFENVCKSFKLNYINIKDSKNMKSKINKLIKKRRPIVCELFVDQNQQSLFKQGYVQKSKGIFEPQPLSEMFPFLKKPIANTNN